MVGGITGVADTLFALGFGQLATGNAGAAAGSKARFETPREHQALIDLIAWSYSQ